MREDTKLTTNVREVRERTGCSFAQCFEAMYKCGDVQIACKYLELKGSAVCRKNPDGSLLTDKQYVELARKEAHGKED